MTSNTSSLSATTIMKRTNRCDSPPDNKLFKNDFPIIITEDNGSSNSCSSSNSSNTNDPNDGIHHTTSAERNNSTMILSNNNITNITNSNIHLTSTRWGHMKSLYAEHCVYLPAVRNIQIMYHIFSSMRGVKCCWLFYFIQLVIDMYLWESSRGQ
jgi:hypothetical protein